MLFGKEDLTLRRVDSGEGRGRWIWLVLLVAVVIALSIATVYKYRHRLPRPEAGAASAAPAASSPALTGDPGQRLLAECRALNSENALQAARDKCFEVLERSRDEAAIREAEGLLGAIHLALVTTPQPMKEKVEYVVEKGDSFERLAKKFSTTPDLIQKSNQIKGHLIHPGDRLRILAGVFTIAISKSRNDLLLKFNGRFFKRYRVGTGKFGKTPAGAFAIVDKIMEPPWWKPNENRAIPFGDKENILGTRWMSIAALEGTEKVEGYGIHGTGDSETVGTQSSAGCVRLTNADVEELFMLVPVGTRVDITD